MDLLLIRISGKISEGLLSSINRYENQGMMMWDPLLENQSDQDSFIHSLFIGLIRTYASIQTL